MKNNVRNKIITNVRGDLYRFVRPPSDVGYDDKDSTSIFDKILKSVLDEHNSFSDIEEILHVNSR